MAAAGRWLPATKGSIRPKADFLPYRCVRMAAEPRRTESMAISRARIKSRSGRSGQLYRCLPHELLGQGSRLQQDGRQRQRVYQPERTRCSAKASRRLTCSMPSALRFWRTPARASRPAGRATSGVIRRWRECPTASLALSLRAWQPVLRQVLQALWRLVSQPVSRQISPALSQLA